MAFASDESEGIPFSDEIIQAAIDDFRSVMADKSADNEKRRLAYRPFLERLMEVNPEYLLTIKLLKGEGTLLLGPLMTGYLKLHPSGENGRG